MRKKSLILLGIIVHVQKALFPMRYIAISILFCLISIITSAQFTYISPMPGTDLHNRETNIILKNGTWIDKESVQDHNLVEIQGSLSGNHDWIARLSDDRKTVVIIPKPVFSYGETVTVTVHSKLKDTEGGSVKGKSFNFKIKTEPTPEQLERYRLARIQTFTEEYGFNPYESNEPGTTRDKDDTTATYPLDSMPKWTISINNNPAPGQIFFTNHEDQTGPYPFTNSFTTIINNDGSIVWARDQGKEGHDFKINANGYMTYFIGVREMWMEMDSNYNIIDSVQCKNGYENSTNEHDMMWYPDNHIFLIAFDNETTDMTAYGGQPDATVQYLVLQELDQNRDVIFQWRSQDPGHFLFTDANQYTSLTNSVVDYIHCNSIFRDDDGNVVISNRNMDEVTKISPVTGNIIWRWGGENNQFTFVNDSNVKHFASQHDVQRIANGHMTMLNNANHMSPQISQAKEYSLDEMNKTATLQWSYQHPDVNGVKVYGSATGSVQRLSNGNTLIDWGLIPLNSDVPNQTEVDSLGNIKWEMSFDSVGQKSYRIHKYVWNPCSRPTNGLIKVKKITSTTAKVDWTQATGWISYDIQYRLVNKTNWKLKTATQSVKKLKSLKPDSVYVFQIRTHCAGGAVSGWTSIDTFKTKPQRIGLDQEENLSLELFPNPANSILQISFALNQDQQITISIFDMTGKMVSQSTQLTDAGEHTIQTDVSRLPAGFYFVELSMGISSEKTGSIKMTQKFVKQ